MRPERGEIMIDSGAYFAYFAADKLARAVRFEPPDDNTPLGNGKNIRQEY